MAEILEPVVVSIAGNTTEFIASLVEAQRQAEEFAKKTDSIGGTGGLGNLGAGAAADTEKIVKNAEQEGSRAGIGFGSHMMSGLEKSLSMLGSFGLPLGPLQEGLRKTSDAAHGTAKEATGLFDTLAGYGKVAAIGLGATFAAAAGEGIHLSISLQNESATLAANANISVAQATKISNAFLDTAGTAEYSAQEMTTAFAGVAGQLAATKGSALTTAQSVHFMRQSMELATATGTSLNTATKTMADTLQAFQLNASQAGHVADILTVSSHMTGQSIGGVEKSLTRVRSSLGSVSPPIGQLASLLVDMTKHGESGRKAMATLQTTFTSFLKPAQQVAKAQDQLKVGLQDLPPHLRALAAEYEKGNVQASVISKATKGLTIGQAALWGQFKKGADAVRLSNSSLQMMGVQALDSHGKLKPLENIIGQLHNRIKGLGPAQAAATLSAMGFGSGAAKMVPVIEAGVKAYKDTVTQVTHVGSAHEAAAKRSQSLQVQFMIMKAAVEDLLTKLGQALMPVIHAVVGAFAKVIGVVVRCKPLLIGLAVVVGGILTATIGAFAIRGLGKLIAMLSEAGGSVMKFGRKIHDLVPPISAAKRAEEEHAAVARETSQKMQNYAKALTNSVEYNTEQQTRELESLAEASGNTERVWQSSMAGIAEAYGAATDEVAAGTSAMEGSMDSVMATAEADGPATGLALDSMLGPIGLLIPIIMLVATHWKEIWGVIKKVAVTVWHVLDGVWEGIKHAVITAFEFIKHHLKIIIEAIVAIILGPIGILVILLVTHWKQVKKDAIEAWNWLLNFFKEIPGKIIGFFSSALKWLEKAGKWILQGLWTGLKIEWRIVEFFWVQLPLKILGYLASAGQWLYHTGLDIIKGLWHGIVTAAKDVWNFYTSINSKILGFFVNAGKWLINVGIDIIKGLANGIGKGAKFVWDGVKNIGGGILHTFTSFFHISSPSRLMSVHGLYLMQGLANGIEENLNEVQGSLYRVTHLFTAFQNSLLSLFGTASTWLTKAGHDITYGLVNGLTSGMAAVMQAMLHLRAMMSSNASTLAQSFTASLQTSLQTSLSSMSLNVATPAAVPAGGGSSTVLYVTSPISIDGRTVAQVVTKYQLKDARGTGSVYGRYAGGNQTGLSTGTNVNGISR